MVQGAVLGVLKHVQPPAVYRSMYKSSSAVKCFTVMGPWNSSQHHEPATAMTTRPPGAAIFALVWSLMVVSIMVFGL